MKRFVFSFLFIFTLLIIGQNLPENTKLLFSASNPDLTKYGISRENNFIFRPQVIYINTNRETYSYDWWGNVISIAYDVEVGGVWMEMTKTEFSYNASGHLLSTTKMYKNNEVWSVYDRYLFSPDGNGNPLSIIHQYLNDGNLENDDKKIYTYTASGDVQTYVQQFWVYGTWRNNIRHSYTYAGPGMLQIDLMGGWDTVSGQWKDNQRHYYRYSGGGGFSSRVNQSSYNGQPWYTLDSLVRTYDGNKITSEVLLYNVNNYQYWQNEYRYIYSYDGSGNLTSYARDFSNYLAPSDWTHDWIRYYTYDVNNHMLTQRILFWSGTNFNNGMRFEYNYDQTGNNIETLYYNGNQSLWNLERKAVYTHDGFGNTLSGVAWFYNNGQWTTGATMDLYFYFNNKQDTLCYVSAMSASIEYLTGTDDEAVSPSSFVLMQNYPNPFNPSTIISYQLPERSNVSLKLFDILGNEIATLVNEEKDAGLYKYELKANSYGLSSGTYFYQLNAGDKIETKKMILLK
ncbi:MAG TPA: T9SS type A sorting domain-containing protein [Ignavibacteriaceae bacterium]|nr:T9SS type A sorting domain-containing protein [Ignavibacteriaceae bacterium]